MKSKLFLAAATVLAIGATTSCGGTPNAYLTVCLASEPQSIDPALNSAVDGATMLVHLDAGLVKYKLEGNKTVLVNDLAKEITKKSATVKNHEQDDDGKWQEVTYEEGTQYTVKLREGLKWSNGDSLTADDFIYSWNRACGSTLAADYGYMHDPICDAVYHENDDEACPTIGIKKVDDLTFTIDLMVDVPYFNQLLAFPTYFPVHKATVEAHPDWATKPSTFVSCGAYKLTHWAHDSYIRIEKNPNYWDAEHVTCPSIKFALSDDDAAMLASFKSGEYDLIDSVPNDQIKELKKNYPNSYKVDGQMGTYYVSFNVNSTGAIFAGKTEEQKAKIRRALALLMDRKYIVDEIGQADQIPANAFVSKGLTDPKGGEFVDWNGPEHNGDGYFKKGENDEEKKANKEEAIGLLKDVGFTYDEATGKFTNVPSFEYLFNTGTGHQDIAKNIHDTLGDIGINMTMKNEEWNTFLATRKAGNYDVARNGWLADYDDPSSYLTMWTTASGNNDSQFGRGEHAKLAIYSADINRDGKKETGLTWAQSYDVLIDLSNKETDENERFEILHEAEDLLMETGAICPIYYYTDIYMVNEKMSGYFNTPLGYKFFHTAKIEGREAK
ncbi:MAG: peptide ABC transporter substrate-binding protein [Bacilli bacterium]|nr:peptide ABC transporter substrate-binding protein [Bacilli bacterium]